MTDIQLAELYGVATSTLRNYKTGTEAKRRLYTAMRHYAETVPRPVSQYPEMSAGQLREEIVRLTEQIETLSDQIAIAVDWLTAMAEE